MTTQSFPFEGQNTNEDEYSKLMRNFRESGAVSDYGGSGLKVSADATGMQVKVSIGVGIVRGHCIWCTAAETVTVPDANTYNRIDMIVARLDPALDKISFECVKGDASGNPPPLVQTDVDVYEVPLARVAVGANVTGILSTDVTDARKFFQPSGIVCATADKPAVGRPGQMLFDALGNKTWVANAAGVWLPVQMIEDTGLLPITLAAGYKSAGDTPSVEVLNGVAYFSGTVMPTSGTFAANVSVTIGSGAVPEGARPGITRQCIIAAAGSQTSTRAVVYSSGTLQVAPSVAASSIDLSGITPYIARN